MPNAWVEHTKAFAKKNGITYGCAISDPKNKASYHKQKGRDAKKTRTPEQESAGMGAEDVNVAVKPQPKQKKQSKAVNKKIVKSQVSKSIDDNEDLQEFAYSYMALTLMDSSDAKRSSATQKRIQTALKKANHNKYKEFTNMTDEEEKDFYSWEGDLDLSGDDIQDVAETWGLIVKMDDDDEFSSIKNKTGGETTPQWYRQFLKNRK